VSDSNQHGIRNNLLNMKITRKPGDPIPVPSWRLSSSPAGAGVRQAGNSLEMLLQGPQSSASLAQYTIAAIHATSKASEGRFKKGN